MERITQINTESEYEVALARAWEIFHPKEGTSEVEEANRLVDLIVAYEKKNYSLD